MRMRITEQRSALNQLSGKLQALSPVQILERGYALVFDSQGAPVKDASRLALGEQISARVAKGRFTAEVKESSS
jgi:exodeoxyribonuclease VII large subunit